jgi:hypothetical protein
LAADFAAGAFVELLLVAMHLLLSVRSCPTALGL